MFAISFLYGSFQQYCCKLLCCIFAAIINYEFLIADNRWVLSFPTLEGIFSVYPAIFSREITKLFCLILSVEKEWESKTIIKMLLQHRRLINRSLGIPPLGAWNVNDQLGEANKASLLPLIRSVSNLQRDYRITAADMCDEKGVSLRGWHMITL